jgi:chromosome segregation ATPase
MEMTRGLWEAVGNLRRSADALSEQIEALRRRNDELSLANHDLIQYSRALERRVARLERQLEELHFHRHTASGACIVELHG